MMKRPAKARRPAITGAVTSNPAAAPVAGVEVGAAVVTVELDPGVLMLPVPLGEPVVEMKVVGAAVMVGEAVDSSSEAEAEEADSGSDSDSEEASLVSANVLVASVVVASVVTGALVTSAEVESSMKLGEYVSVPV